MVFGSSNHSIDDCPFKRTYPTLPIFPARAATQALPALAVRRNSESVVKRDPFPPQQHEQTQRGTRAGRDQVYNLLAGEAEASGEVVAECGAQYPK